VRLFPFMPVACLFLAGCAGSDYLVQRQGSMEGRINQIMQSQNGTTAQLAEMSVQIRELKEQAARHAAADKLLAADHAALQEKVQMLSRRLERKDADAASTQVARIELVNQQNEGESREEKVQSAYMRAFGLFSSNRYDAAAEAFTAFIEAYPESEHAANARYWLGECHFAAGRYNQAIDAFAKVLSSDKRGADAMLKTGLAWYGLNEREKGQAVLKALLEKFPGSEAAAKAAETLEQK